VKTDARYVGIVVTDNTSALYGYDVGRPSQCEHSASFLPSSSNKMYSSGSTLVGNLLSAQTRLGCQHDKSLLVYD
jgi:hypothetical protein